MRHMKRIVEAYVASWIEIVDPTHITITTYVEAYVASWIEILDSTGLL